MPCEELPAGVQGPGGGGGTTATTATTAANATAANATTTTSDKLVRTEGEEGPLTAFAAPLVTAGAALGAVARRRLRPT